ncbi:hypothetical protein AM1_3913 [Acaryochloris marina MBIC11017]|uniref:Uncharacterized protein n=1 Tax=Acaryochloris marina (strain MBIC 11017) TaxID=329726 RepID=B0C878_ACAM1|nr:hypothetical protein AM1_3913 [Acaryochloris marina MBIC11017]
MHIKAECERHDLESDQSLKTCNFWDFYESTLLKYGLE